ncbi:MAG: hypothetical protein WDM71_02025 [Ferruginibacter sp.]
MGSHLPDQRCIDGCASVKRICESSRIDRWFIYQIQKICDCEKQIANYSLKTLPDELLREAKFLGFSDEQIVRIMREENAELVYDRRKAMGLTRVFKMGWIPAAQSLKQRLLTSILHSKINQPYKARLLVMKVLLQQKRK